MEHQLILAVSGFPSLYDTTAPSYRDLNMRADSWRHVAESIAVPESECRRKWKTLRDQHRRERQREKDRRESGVGLFNYRPWRYSAILSFLNPFIDARAAGCNGWALDPQPSHLQAHEMGCSTTTGTRSDDDDEGGYDVDATTTSSDFLRRKRPSSAGRDADAFKQAKMEAACEGGARDDCVAPPPHDDMKELFEAMMRSVTSLAASLASSRSSSLASDQPPPPGRPAPRHDFRRLAASRLSHLKTEQREDRTEEEEEEEEEEEQRQQQQEDEEDEGEEEEGGGAAASTGPSRAKRKSGESLLVEYLRRMEAREAQREQRDDVALFLLSLAPAVRRLPAQKQSWVRTKMQQFVHEAEFGATSFQ